VWTQDLRADRPRRRLVHFRWAWTWYSAEDARRERTALLTISGEAVLPRRPVPEFSARFHAGTKFSETPFDVHASVGGAALYLNTSAGGRLAHRMSRGQGRDLKVFLMEHRIFLSAWTTTGSWERGRFAAWRDASFSISPADHILGQRRFHYDDVDKVTAELVLADGTYPVELTLQRQTIVRERGKPRFDGWCVDWNAPHGIPTKRDAGWKGGSTYGSGFTVSAPHRPVESREWVGEALNRLAAWVYTDRARNRWSPPVAGTSARAEP
jgi:hypothetical protein